ncbi:hypothetical protein HUJ04_000693 [Dendroctonus ponderosae]|uniref:BTB domain-containing protein n=1 Tax=Dendroctonus ponderosae TaxID=77166 RepID=A0AAR5NZ34_DENPD|nr:hypothetical protein HUJ04_000693 [Dendroctonus ponderosae]KAH1011286.1 hypothetical protein HUJ04_000693 [Dendroctonus ponderosae]
MATTEQFSLRWNNFHYNLKSGFHGLLQQAEMVDVTLAVDGHFLQAHKVVLSICSPYFKEMFMKNPCKHPIVILKDVGHDNMKYILQFMYMGEVSILKDNLPSFLRTAEVLQVKGLTGEDSTEDSGSQKEQKASSEIDDVNEMYNQLIETTTDTDIPQLYLQKTPPPPQTSPLPLNFPKRHAKSISPNRSKRSKCSESYSSEYSASKPVTNVDCDTPKSNTEYKSCDLTTTQRDIKPVIDDSEEAKDYSKNSANIWKGNLLYASGAAQEAGASNCSDQNTADQDSSLYAIDAKEHVFCPHCCRKFVNRYNLKVHIRDKHESNSTDLDCQVCGKTMRNQSCLRVHLYHHRKQQTEGTGIVM